MQLHLARTLPTTDSIVPGLVLVIGLLSASYTVTYYFACASTKDLCRVYFGGGAGVPPRWKRLGDGSHFPVGKITEEGQF